MAYIVKTIFFLLNPRWPASYSLFNFISFTSFLSHKKEQKGPAPGTFESLAPLARELLRNITRSSLACR